MKMFTLRPPLKCDLSWASLTVGEWSWASDFQDGPDNEDISDNEITVTTSKDLSVRLGIW